MQFRQVVVEAGAAAGEFAPEAWPAALGEEAARAAPAAVSRLPAGDQEVLGLRYWLGRSLSLQGRWQEAGTGLRLLLAE
ncbi:hypothetical protein J5Y04_37590 [Kitasatospora sp. RG8]|uniref:hypothetical protein n=1 Tax=Kitasatospora sp. RG8 TaxID=2820815 RepID=UPI001AE0C666|nr:hypothetical protein [Kitasatospora sp. RG8]MBP0455187.1 hypothetical protein [Kitasatospora sp. RG8]